MAKWLTIKEVHRETFQGEKIILCGTGVVNTLVKTHKTINHKKGTLIMQIKKKKKKHRSIPGQNPDCDK